VILVDANLLLYAYNPSLDHHAASKRWVETTFAGSDPVRLAWVTITAFLRITTNPRAFEQPLSIDEATAIVTEWLVLPNVDTVEPTELHWGVYSRLLLETPARGPFVMDAHLAALSIEHGATLFTTDRDFVRFQKLKSVNPLQ